MWAPALPQVGAAEYTPRRLFPPNSRTAQLHNGLAVEFFDFAPSLAAHMEAAALVISHAGERAASGAWGRRGRWAGCQCPVEPCRAFMLVALHAATW